MDLFSHSMKKKMERESPLAARIRPKNLDEYIGQEHIVGQGKLLRRAIAADKLSSLILWGPPGTGKTTLAMVIANHTESSFEILSAVMAGKAQLREVIGRAEDDRRLYGKQTILFIDEVHRWNKAQQDALLPYVETGLITLIGATTENPYFEVNSALVSRSRIFHLEPLTDENLNEIIDIALNDPQRGYGGRPIQLDDDARAHFIRLANGDARNVLNALELAVESTEPDADKMICVTLTVAEESIQERALLYDKDGDAHYDTISAFIKSVRGSDPDAALYWLAKMLESGESPRFILRRLIILAGEDIGLADPHGLQVATSAAYAFEYIGLPEGIFPIVEATLYLATAPKSNSALAYFKVVEQIKQEGVGGVPNHLKDANRDAKGLGHGEGYKYPHSFEGHHVAQQYLPDYLQGEHFYKPSQEGYESIVYERLAALRRAQQEGLQESSEGENEK
jgi:putative ATPase